ncbi:MAG: GNAT family N-acetyltransferase [Dehalococcoidia bacterium]|nr:GNAT family N-acetyltransferase [Dehalococcoidia bacterium]
MTGTASPPVVIAETPRTRVRTKVRADAADDFAWRKDPEMQRYNGEPPSDATFDEFLVQFEFDLAFGHERRKMFSIDSRADDRHIGNIMFYNADRRSGTVEFGMSLAKDADRGTGLGREVTAAFLRYLFNEHPFRRVILHTLEWNERARRAFTAAGFEPADRVQRSGESYIRMEARREWWLMRDAEGCYAFSLALPRPAG